MNLLAVLIPLFVLRDPAGGCDRYEVQRVQADAWVSTAHYGGPALTPKVPNAGPVDTLWVSESTASRTVDAFRCRCVSGDSAGTWSPTALSGAAWPDTLAAAVGTGDRVAGWTRTAMDGRLYFSIPASERRDSTLRVVHQEVLQRRYSAKLVELYGYWYLRGQQQFEPDYWRALFILARWYLKAEGR